LNAYVRFRLALTEDAPTIRPYEESRWAELPDARTLPVEVSLRLLDAVHTRWVALLNSLSSADFARTYVHPEHGRPFTLDEAVSMYAWHSRHHTAHITTLRDRMGW
ncbi:MAG TPA: DinB family protein, partial [Rhodothermales bacterium]|nr:DinB family protein [Rhodothermales bacterium]